MDALCDEKNAHLKILDNATDNLKLFKADLQDYSSLCATITGCTEVLHVTSLVPAGRAANPVVEVIGPFVKGTHNILKACSETKVERVVDQPMDETRWSDKVHKEHCKKISENEAFHYAKTKNLDTITICPSFTFGLKLQSKLNSSSMILAKILEGISSSREICPAFLVEKQDFTDKLKGIFSPKISLMKIPEEEKFRELNCEILKKLGWTTRLLEDTLADSIQIST
ncbi:hypothetical protein MKX01_005508 [Papaver californicum]|nr:hypothetical protein MKX01_005508 [Papaver californicum]